MKYILILFAFISTSAIAQVDSSQLLISLQLKTKFALDMWPSNPTDKDARLLDSLRKVIGTGDSLEKVTTVKFKVGTYYKMVDELCANGVAAYYNDGIEFFTAPLSVNGYSGFLSALDYYVTQPANPSYAGALYLRWRIYDLIISKRAPISQKRDRNKAIATAQPVYN